MAAKRLLGEPDEEIDHLEPRRLRRRPSFAAFVSNFIVKMLKSLWYLLFSFLPLLSSVIAEAVMVESLQSFCSALEPMLRRVVNEEVERGLTRGANTLHRPLPLQIQAPEFSMLELCFAMKLSLPVFTGSKIEDEYNQPLRLIILEGGGNPRAAATLPFPIRIEIVVLDGDFAEDECKQWTSEYFESKIVRERTGRRPLITGDVAFTMRDGDVTIGDIVFTDNSSWIRSRKFRLGARVERGSVCHGGRILEAITEPFVVKDHRGELYKKHHPPSLNDEVWRLEKIGKDGVFHRRLITEKVTTVQDFLKLWVVDPVKLRGILGVGMSDKVFEITINHAKNCILGRKHYIWKGRCFTIYLNPICQVVRVLLNGMPCPTSHLPSVQKARVENLVREAYAHWNSLEEIDGFVNENALLH